MKCTKDELNLKSGNFVSDGNFTLFTKGIFRDFTLPFHRQKSHIITSLSANSASFTVRFNPLAVGKWGIRIEGIAEPSITTFDTDITSPGPALKRQNFKHIFQKNVIIIEQFMNVTGSSPENITIHINSETGKEIAFYIYGRRGEGHVDPMIIDNFETEPFQIVIPKYRSLENIKAYMCYRIFTNLPGTHLSSDTVTDISEITFLNKTSVYSLGTISFIKTFNEIDGPFQKTKLTTGRYNINWDNSPSQTVIFWNHIFTKAINIEITDASKCIVGTIINPFNFITKSARLDITDI